MKMFEYRKFPGIATTRLQWTFTLGRISFSMAYLSEFVGPLKWFVVTPVCAKCASWSGCIWIHRVGFGVATDFIGLKNI